MSEIGYYMKALKRFRPEKMKIYLATIPDRARMHRYFKFTSRSEKIEADYICVRGGREHYLCRCDDIAIPMYMYDTGRTYSEEDIEKFFRLCKEYYGYEPKEDDVFFDIGANIGTTSVYVSKNISSKLLIYSFEPEPENYKLLKANAVINNCDNIRAFNVAVSNKEETLKLEITARNRGANRIVSDFTVNNEFPDTVIQVEAVTIDKFILENRIDAQSVKYIWMDVEGHEPQAILGMRELLEKNKVPLFMEFTPKVSSKASVEQLMQILSAQYEGFIAFGGEDYKRIMKIGDLMELYGDATFYQYDVFFY